MICSDKTGTLTKNEMTVTSCVTADLQYGEFSGIGYRSTGELIFQDSGNHKAPSSVSTISSNQSNNHLRRADQNVESFVRIFQTGVLCNNAQVVQGKLFGQPTEGAIVVGAEKLGIDVSVYRSQFARLEEQPFNSDTKIMIVRCRCQTNDTELYHVKGAIENVLKNCTHFFDNGKHTELTAELKNQYLIEAEHVLAKKGLRVLGFSFGDRLDQQIFLGMVGIMDPPRYGVEDSVRTLSQSGVQIKMVTGDAEGTATSIGESINVQNF